MIERQTSSSAGGFRISPQLIVGFLILFAGVVFTLDELGIAPAASYLRFWPTALIAIGVLKMLQSRDGGGAFVGLVFALVGVWLQAEELNIFHISVRNVWPLGLVAFGGYLMWQALTRRPAAPRVNRPPLFDTPAVDVRPVDVPPADVPPVDVRPFGSPPLVENPPRPSPQPDARDNRTSGKKCGPKNSSRITDTNSTMSAVAILGGVSRGNNSRAFRRADLLAIMGGCEIDLRQAAIHGEAVIDLFAMWGGIQIRVPEDWTVVSQVFPLMGGIDDKTRPPQGLSEHRLVLRGAAVMGGVEIKN